jgi:putative transcriptional regulator
MPNHHPQDDLLLEYATGAMREPLALLVATHLALCPECREEVGQLDALGGAFLDNVAPEPVSQHALERALALLEGADQTPLHPASPGGTKPAPVGLGEPVLPWPLRDYVGDTFAGLAWKKRGGKMDQADLMPTFAGYTTRLVRIKAGAAVPEHSHLGNEFVLVLSGAFSDRLGQFGRGDVSVADSQVTHKPVAGPDEDCVCLAVTDAPLRLTGPVGRLLNPFIRL